MLFDILLILVVWTVISVLLIYAFKIDFLSTWWRIALNFPLVVLLGIILAIVSHYENKNNDEEEDWHAVKTAEKEIQTC